MSDRTKAVGRRIERGVHVLLFGLLMFAFGMAVENYIGRTHWDTQPSGQETTP